MGGIKMFNIGDKVVYPMHGAGVIESIEEKEILGQKQKYYIMKMPIGDIQVMVPTSNAVEVGMREVIACKDADRVLSVLSSDITEMNPNWNKRYRANMESMKTGDILAVAEVARNLHRIDKVKNLSNGEKQMLSNAMQIMSSELILVKDITIDEAKKLICESIDV
jgi:CarD family transcriptional regulator